MRNVTLTSLALAFAVASVSVVGADTLTLKRGAVDPIYFPGGYAGAADTTIYYYSPPAGHPALPEVWMRSSNGGFGSTRTINGPTGERSLYRYDLSGLTGKGISVTGDATLSFIVNGGTGASTGAAYALYQIASANAGWVEGNNVNSHNPTTAVSRAHNGDATWFYKSIDTVNNLSTTTAAADTTSVKWASGQASVGVAGSNAEGYANTGGLWNPIDLIDQDLSTPATSYLNMDAAMDPVALADAGDPAATMTFNIPRAMVQNWIDNPTANAGLLGRFTQNSYLDLWSSEAGAALRPSLTFDFSVNPATPGDFNNDGLANATDIDLLFDTTQGSIPPAIAIFDVNADGTVNSRPNTPASDADQWVRGIKNTEYGDTTLNGTVDFDDLLALAQHYGSASTSWADGDVDGVNGVAFDDLLLLAQNYGFGSALLRNDQFWSDWQLAQSMVPEPSTLVTLSLVVPALRRRR
jgi:hypothetical protein